MALDYDTWKNDGSEDEPEIDICLICDEDFDKCDHTETDLDDWRGEYRAESMFESAWERENEDDLNAEVDW